MTKSWELLAWKLNPLWIQISRMLVLWNSYVVLGRNKCYHHSQCVTEQLVGVILPGIHRDGG